MQTKLVRLAIAGALACLAVSALGQIKWVSGYDAALKQAKATNKLVMVEFYTTWDRYGKRLEAVTFTDSKVVAFASKVIPVRVNVEKEGRELGKKFNITNYPTVMFVDKSQNDVGTIDGFEGPEDFLKHSNVFLADYAKEPALRAKHKADPKDLTAITALGVIEANRYHTEAALRKVREAEAIDPKNSTDKLSDLYNAVADIYQNASKFDSAITYFKKVVETSKSTDKKAYGYLSIVTCYLTWDAPPDPEMDMPSPPDPAKVKQHLEAALPYAIACLKLPNLKAEDKQLAQNYRQIIQRALNGDDQ